TTRTRIAESAVATADGAAETARPIYATRTQTLSTALNTSHTGERRPPRVESPEPPRRAPSDQPNLLEFRLDDVLVERLHDVLGGPAMQRARDVGDVVLGGAEHDLRAVAARHPPQRPQELVAVHLRHVPVEQDRVRQPVLTRIQRHFAVLGLGDLEFQSFEDAPRHLADHARVVDDQTGLHSTRSSVERANPLPMKFPRRLRGGSRRNGLVAGIENAIDVEHHEKLLVEAMDAAGHAREM